VVKVAPVPLGQTTDSENLFDEARRSIAEKVYLRVVAGVVHDVAMEAERKVIHCAILSEQQLAQPGA
jgi:hypothetical protein